MAETEEAVIIRRNIVKENNSQAETTGDTESEQESENDSKDVRLTLMEEVLLLGLKDREGYLSFWNDSVSCGLRGCILVELGLRNRIGLEPSGMRRRSLLSRCIVVKKTVPTGDALLDEALKHIKENKPENTKTWVEYLSECNLLWFVSLFENVRLSMAFFGNFQLKLFLVFFLKRYVLLIDSVEKLCTWIVK
ncbi:unnamed protein product [Heterobilharzia americana]|nr:unnamed protein product [Heterobilharzia americana]